MSANPNFPQDAFRRSVVDFPTQQELLGGNTHILTTALNGLFANVADRISPWGLSPWTRDSQLRQFWPTEPFLAGAIGSVATRYAAIEWEVTGPDRLANAVTDMLNGAISGTDVGWIPFMLNWGQDYHVQDNGAMIELIRDPGMDAASRFKGANAPVVGIAHLDANRCSRTGNPQIPIIYTDRQGREHKMKWFDVIPMSEFPSPIEKMHGIGVCAVSRVLRYAQIMQSIATFKDEKVSGRHFRAMHIVSGVSRQQITDVEKRGQEEADNQGQIRFILPAILASIDPEKPVSHVEIPLASLPDNFDFDTEMRWYISALALGFNVDYQDFAPLPTGNIGSSSQSEILDKKSRSKGPSLVMSRIPNAFKNYGVLPRGTELVFKPKDLQEELEQTAMLKQFSETMAILTRADILDADTVRKVMEDMGLLGKELIANVPEGHGVTEFVNAGKSGEKQMLGTAGGTNEGQNISRQEKSKQQIAKELFIKKFKEKAQENRG